GDDQARWARLDDPVFVQHCAHESLRLHPASPEAWRSATCPMDVAGIGPVGAHDRVELDLFLANRDTAIFGESADRFDPDREVPDTLLRSGLAFGIGLHTCLGRELDGGVVARPGTDPAQAQLGIVTLILVELLRHGARTVPDDPPQRDVVGSQGAVLGRVVQACIVHTRGIVDQQLVLGAPSVVRGHRRQIGFRGGRQRQLSRSARPEVDIVAGARRPASLRLEGPHVGHLERHGGPTLMRRSGQLTEEPELGAAHAELRPVVAGTVVELQTEDALIEVNGAVHVAHPVENDIDALDQPHRARTPGPAAPVGGGRRAMLPRPVGQGYDHPRMSRDRG
ncbi:MAG: cytochrome P450, partial [Mycobacteriaceae bacterium]|nr:cytochrome P450 [Mycobacteriaceae bacterium]